jgi:hypothetical protein
MNAHNSEFDFYGATSGYQPESVVLSGDDLATLTHLMREVMDLTQSRTSYSEAAELLSRLTGEASQSRLVRPEVLAQ